MFARAGFAFRIYGNPVNIQFGWALLVLAAAGATLLTLAPEAEARGGALVWYVNGVVLVGGLLGSLLLHELGHVIGARRAGKRIGAVRLYPFGSGGEGFVEPGTPRQDVVVATAGLGVTAALAAATGLAWWALPGRFEVMRADFGYLALGNAALTVFNLLPGYPLDGGRVFRALVWYLHDDFITGTRAAVAYAQVISTLALAMGLAALAVRSSYAIWGLWVVLAAWSLNRASRDELTRAFFVVAGAGLTARETVEGMNPRVGADQSVDEVIEHLLTTERVGPALVTDGDEVVGVLTLGRLRHFRRADWPRRTARDAMVSISTLPRVDHDISVRDLLAWVADVDADILLVTDQGEVVGALDHQLAVQRLLDRARSRHRLRGGR